MRLSYDQTELKRNSDLLLYQFDKQPIELTKEWVLTFPEMKAVYVIFENEIVIYVGETLNLREEMKNLLDTRTHIFRRILGKIKYSNESTYCKATTKNKFSNEIETLLDDYMINHLMISYIENSYRSKELEEFIIRTQTDIINTNIQTIRDRKHFFYNNRMSDVPDDKLPWSIDELEKLVLLKYEDKKSNAEIGRILKRSVGAIRYRLNKIEAEKNVSKH